MSPSSRSGPDARHPALALNPEAGAHHVCEDPVELAAALRAGERTWQMFSYYGQRYGDRGRAFTRSDSAWIVTLARSPSADEQVLWLGGVLASRGMPRWLLQIHLEHLHQELTAAHPDQPDTYVSLRKAAQMLAERRRARLSDAAFAAIEHAFDERTEPTWRTELPRTGALIAAAVADERDGLTRAVSSLETWLADPARFPARWVEAVRSTIEQARAAR